MPLGPHLLHQPRPSTHAAALTWRAAALTWRATVADAQKLPAVRWTPPRQQRPRDRMGSTVGRSPQLLLWPLLLHDQRSRC